MDAAVSDRAAPASWFICPKPNVDAKMRLFCLPFAGGGASTYHSWPRAFPHEVEIRALQLPGRESRMREPRFTVAAALADVLAQAIEPYLDRPFAFFGYSMGALLAFEAARALRRRGQALPAQLFVAAMRAPHVRGLVPPLSRLPREELLREVRRHYEPPEATFEIPELVDVLLPVLRDDMALVDDYRYVPEPPLACAIDAYVGSRDRSVPVEAAARWREQSAGEFALSVLPGGHFFLQEALPRLQREVAARLSTLTGAR